MNTAMYALNGFSGTVNCKITDLSGAGVRDILVNRTFNSSNPITFGTPPSFTLTETGEYYIEFQATHNSAFALVPGNPHLAATFISIIQMARTVTLTARDQTMAYRYGFNTQMLDNNLAGMGNHLTAQYWEYDPRYGRRWNLDPVRQYYISQYSTFGNNPIRFTDVNGDVAGDGEGDPKPEKKKTVAKPNHSSKSDNTKITPPSKILPKPNATITTAKPYVSPETKLLNRPTPSGLGEYLAYQALEPMYTFSQMFFLGRSWEETTRLDGSAFQSKTDVTNSYISGLTGILTSVAGMMQQTSFTVSYRYMSDTEVPAVLETGFLRGGRPGPTYYTNKYYGSSSSAQQSLSLQNPPTTGMSFTIRNSPRLKLANSPVKPVYGQPGGGKEWMTQDAVKVKVRSIFPLKP